MGLKQAMNRLGNNNKGVIAVLTLGLTGATIWAIWPTAPQDVADASRDGNPFNDIFAADPLGNLSLGEGTVHEVQIKYDSGTLAYQGRTALANVTEARFEAQTTAVTGTAARFELFCGETACGSTEAKYQDPLTFFLVTVPPLEGLTRMTVTAGAAFLEVDFAS